MKPMLILLVTLGLIGLFGSAALGGDAGARAAAMGGAYTAVADDGTAPYWNPAGITQVKVFILTPAFGIQGDISSLFDLLDGTSTYGGFKTMGTAIAGITTKYVAVNYFGDLAASGIGTYGSFIGTGVGLGYGALTIAGKFGDLAIGINAKKVYEEYAVLTSTGVDLYSLSATGEGLGYDIGALYHISDNFKVGAMARNVSGSVNWTSVTYKKNDVVQATHPTITDKLPKTYMLGLAYYPYKSLLIAVDFEKIDALNDNEDQSRTHLGLEQTALWNAVSLRLGTFTNKDRPNGVSGGLGLKLGPVVVDLAGQKVGDLEASYFVSAGFKF
jgi:hypothetical protein